MHNAAPRTTTLLITAGSGGLDRQEVVPARPIWEVATLEAYERRGDGGGALTRAWRTAPETS